MKVAFLHMTMGLTNRGSEVVIDSLATALSKKHNVLMIQSGKVMSKSYEVKRVYPQSVAPPAAPRTLLEKLLFRLHLDAESMAIVKFSNKAVSELTKFDPDIIVTVNGPLQVRIVQDIVQRAKVVVFGHAGIGYHDRDNLKSNPDLFIALTPTAFNWALKYKRPGTKVVYIPNPISVTKASGVKIGLPHPIVLTVGALTKYKNIDKVIKAVSQLQASLLLIGDGEESDHISDLLSKFPGEFRWLKSVEPENIGSYYQSSDIFCFVPDSQEAFGRVYLEAMVTGLPIVASDDSIRREIVGSKGNYANPHDIDSIVSALQAASTQGKIDYSDALKPYNLKNVISNIERELHALIS